MSKHYGIVGAGGWGTALALVLARKGCRVSLWARSPGRCREIQEAGENRKYLPGVPLGPMIEISSNLGQVVQGKQLVVLAVPSHALRETAAALRDLLNPGAITVNVAKGIENETLLRMSQVLQEELGPGDRDRIAVLSGPNHAEEVSRGVPSATVVAALQRKAAEYVQEAFMSSSFRVYTNPDLVGIELGGALKNIIALGSGISDGLGFGDNTKAALMTRGVVEITRLGVALGARPLTFAGLSGIGDLIATCTSRHSRNRKAGFLLGRGKSREEITREMDMVVEGFKTARAALPLSEKLGVEMPITREVYQVAFQGKDPRKAVLALMGRTKKNEMEEIVSDKFKEWH